MANASTEEQVMITTLDNPYNPFTQYEEWLALDTARGYFSPGLLARYTITSNELSSQDQAKAILEGINDLIRENPFGMYRKVTPSDYESEN